MKEALFWKKRDDGSVVCELCPRRCVLREGQLGGCGTRGVKDGTLYALTYAKPCAIHVDPVEKKPLFHFYPGEPILSLATVGCNLFCDFCQNWEISKRRAEALGQEEDVPPERIVALAEEAGCRLIAFTYTEPTVFYEYMLAIATLAKKRKMECAIVSNGYIEEAPLQKLIPLIAAANIDLKGSKEFYRKRCKVPDHERIKKTVVALKDGGVHVEITNLLIPGENDSDEEIERLAKWIAANVGKGTPLHFSAFHPDYKMLNAGSTPVRTLLRARGIAKRHLDFVYLGNVPGLENGTRCPGCDALLVDRSQHAGVSFLEDGRCPTCKRPLPGRFSGGKR